MLERYSRIIFDYIGVEFEVLEIVIHPVRPGPWEQKDFRKIVSGKYKYQGIEDIDGPNYYTALIQNFSSFKPKKQL